MLIAKAPGAGGEGLSWRASRWHAPSPAPADPWGRDAAGKRRGGGGLGPVLCMARASRMRPCSPQPLCPGVPAPAVLRGAPSPSFDPDACRGDVPRGASFPPPVPGRLQSAASPPKLPPNHAGMPQRCDHHACGEQILQGHGGHPSNAPQKAPRGARGHPQHPGGDSGADPMQGQEV